MPDTPAPPATLPVKPVSGSFLYTGIGHAPFAPETAVHLPAEHAEQLVAAGVATHDAPEPSAAA